METRGPIGVLLMLAGLAYGAAAQGAFYRTQFPAFVLIMAVAGALSLGNRDRTRRARFPRWALLALAASAVLSGWANGSARDILPELGLILALVSASLVVERLEPSHAAVLVSGLVALGVVMALTGWAAVVWRVKPEALLDRGLWRAASTLTYENALAGFLLVPCLWAAAKVAEGSASPAWSLATAALLLGIGATLSRGGAVGLFCGLAILGWRVGWTHFRRLGPAVTGAVAALAALVPSFPTGPAGLHAVLALGGLAVGALLVLRGVRGFSPRLLRMVVPVVAAVVILALGGAGGVWTGKLAHTRLTLASIDRQDFWSATWKMVPPHPVLGTGPGHFRLRYNKQGVVYTARYAHNEYLQLLAEQGVVGLAIMAAFVLAVVRSRDRRGGGDWSRVGALAGFGGVMVHSGLDFLWHIPVIAVTGVVAASVAVAAPPTPPGST